MIIVSIYCTELRCEYQKEPVGIDNNIPRFFWKIRGDSEGVAQSAYEIIVEDVWSSGRVESDSSVQICYGGKPLKPFTRYNYSVRVWDAEGNCSDFAHSFFETGILSPKNFLGSWIACPSSFEGTIFRHEFEIDAKVTEARLYITAYGVYEAELNGARVGDLWLTPGYTAFDDNLLYQTYDVTDLLKRENAICITLAKGWHSSRIGKRSNHKQQTQGILAMLRIKKENGEVCVVTTGEGWRCRSGACLFSDIYDGEIYDASLDDKRWRHFGFDDSDWHAAKVVNLPKDNLTYQINEPIRINETVLPISIFVSPRGERILDFGQNLVGWVEFRVKGRRGERVVLSHAEVLDRDGNFYTDNMRSAKNKVIYYLSGEGEEVFHPRFTFQGFRYVRIDEYPGEPRIDDFVAIVIYSDMESTGSFECSNPAVNKLFANAFWSQKGNYVDIPTDCPQRDERLGWTGDAQVFIKAGALNMNVALFFTKWLRDLAAEQEKEGGAVPNIIPNTSKTQVSAAWGDAAVICPIELYHAYGDRQLLSRQYKSMRDWVEYIRSCCTKDRYLWNTGTHFGDWLGIDAQEGSYKGATDQYLIATAFYAYSSRLLSLAAKILGFEEDADKYKELSENVAKRFKEEYLIEGALPKTLTQTACSIVLRFGLTDDNAKTAAALARLVEENNYHLTTGFVGTPYLLYALSDNGYPDHAYRLLLQNDYPSWLYSVNAGATTIWEHWDGIKPDGSFWSEDMNSFNHYAYGAVVDWMYTRIAGINCTTEAPGYKKSVIRPLVTQRLSYAKATVMTLYGALSSKWTRDKEGNYIYEVTIPNNTVSEFIFPDGRRIELKPGTHILC